MHMENNEHAIPAIIIVVNFGVSGCHLKVVANIAKPIEQNKPKVQPKNVPANQSLYAIKNIPNNDTKHAIAVVIPTFSLRKI